MAYCADAAFSIDAVAKYNGGCEVGRILAVLGAAHCTAFGGWEARLPRRRKRWPVLSDNLLPHRRSISMSATAGNEEGSVPGLQMLGCIPDQEQLGIVFSPAGSFN